MGPLLFLLFINDLPSAILAKPIIFADDTAVITYEKTTDDLQTKANAEFQKLLSWFGANRLVLNLAKTKSMNFFNGEIEINIHTKRNTRECLSKQLYNLSWTQN